MAVEPGGGTSVADRAKDTKPRCHASMKDLQNKFVRDTPYEGYPSGIR